jgi:phenylpropionate dioxygenase-like ring-hydroxylating dioxygenase large terminal subunit
MAAINIGQRQYDSAGAIESFDRATTLRPEFYLDPYLYRMEKARVMRSQWLPIARVEDVVSNGDYLATELLDEQLLVTRDIDGVLRVLSNVCRHRAMLLATGSGNCRTLQCPYHLWSYQLDGSLSGSPMMAGIPYFDRTAVRLPEVKHEVWQGWIMVNIDGAAQPLAEQVKALTAAIGEWGFTNLQRVASQSYECAWNWKIIVDNFSEYYHHLGLHRDTLEPFLPARNGWCLDNGGEPWSSSVMTCAPDYLALQGERMSGLDNAKAGTMQIFTLFPLLCAGAQGSSAFWLHVAPLAVDRSRVTWNVLVRPERSDDVEFIRASLSAIDTLQDEDALACRGVQAGLRSATAAPGRLARLEKPIWQFQRWLLAKLQDSDED